MAVNSSPNTFHPGSSGDIKDTPNLCTDLCLLCVQHSRECSLQYVSGKFISPLGTSILISQVAFLKEC